MAFVAARAEVEGPITHAQGTVSGFDDDAGLLTIETRLGRRQFFITGGTLILLNGRAGDTGDFGGGNNGVNEDYADVAYHIDSLEAVKVRLTREQRRSGRITAADDNSIDLRLRAGGALELEMDNQSRRRAAGVKVEDAAAMVGLNADAVFEPGTGLLISIQAAASTLRGRVTAVDDTAETLTVDGPRDLSFVVPDNATIRRAGQTATLADVAVGDRAQVVFARRGVERQVVALIVRPAPAKP